MTQLNTCVIEPTATLDTWTTYNTIDRGLHHNDIKYTKHMCNIIELPIMFGNQLGSESPHGPFFAF